MKHYITLSIMVLTFTACAGMRGDYVTISKEETYTRHEAYMKANYYCKSRGKFAFAEKQQEHSERYYYFKCK